MLKWIITAANFKKEIIADHYESHDFYVKLFDKDNNVIAYIPHIGYIIEIKERTEVK